MRADYDIAHEAFEVVVPRSYRPDMPHGLFVFIITNDVPAPQGWVDALAHRKLIWVSPRNAGNDRDWPVRLCLALDAVHNMKKRYNIDEQRIYIAGFSGGGNIASTIIRGYPEVFRGAYCMHVYSFGGGRKDEHGLWEPTLDRRAWRGPIDAIKKDVRLVLMDGEGDPDAVPGAARATCEGLRLDGFERVNWLEVPKLGHRAGRGLVRKGLGAAGIQARAGAGHAADEGPQPAGPDRSRSAARPGDGAVGGGVGEEGGPGAVVRPPSSAAGAGRVPDHAVGGAGAGAT